MFFLFIFIILIILSFAVYTCRIGCEVENLKIDTQLPKGEKINKDSKIYIYLIILKKIKLFKKNVRNINNKKIKFLNKDIDIQFLKDRDIKIDYKDLIQKIDIYFDQIDLKIQFGTQDAALTAILTGIIASALGIILKKPRYEIIPIYSNENFVKIKLDCIFSIHLMQYIYKIISNNIKEFGNKSQNKKVEV